MPLEPQASAQDEKYLVLAGESDLQLWWGIPRRYIILFLKGDFTIDEADAFAVAAFHGQEEIPPIEEYFREDSVDAYSMGVSVIDELPRKFAYLLSNYSVLEYTSSYDFNLFCHIHGVPKWIEWISERGRHPARHPSHAMVLSQTVDSLKKECDALRKDSLRNLVPKRFLSLSLSIRDR